MIYKVKKSKDDAIRFLNFLELNLTVEIDKKNKLKLVLEELLMNSLNHSPKNIQPLEINITTNDTDIYIEYHEYSEYFNIIDFFNKNFLSNKNITPHEEGGLGIFLIFNFIKNYDFFYDEKEFKNILKFKL